MSDAQKGCVVILCSLTILFCLCGFGGWLIQPSEADIKQAEGDKQAKEAAELAKQKHDEHLAQLDRDKIAAKEIRDSLALSERNEAKLAKFRDLAAGVDVIASTAVRSDGSLVVAVQNGWHYEPKAIRLQAAQNIGKLWESCSPGSDFSIVDLNGNEVGGRGFTGVWVVD